MVNKYQEESPSSNDMQEISWGISDELEVYKYLFEFNIDMKKIWISV
jgi:hypothetical protein